MARQNPWNQQLWWECKGAEARDCYSGFGRRLDMARIDLMNTNAQIVKSVVKEVVKYASDCKLMIVTNPVLIMSYVAFRQSGFPRSAYSAWAISLIQYAFLGQTLLLDVSREDTHLVSDRRTWRFCSTVEYVFLATSGS